MERIGYRIVVGIVWLSAVLVSSMLATALGSLTGWNEYGWQSLVGDILILGPVFPLVPLTASAMYDLLARNESSDVPVKPAVM